MKIFLILKSDFNVGKASGEKEPQRQKHILDNISKY